MMDKPNAIHHFDHESLIERSLKKYVLQDGQKTYDGYEFIDSKDNRFVQTSDVLVGLLSDYFHFTDTMVLERSGSMPHLSEEQKNGISMLDALMKFRQANGGFTQAIVSLSQVPAQGTALQGPFTSMFGPDLPNLLGVVVLTSLGTWGLPQMVQKFYAIKSGPAIKQGAIISTFFAIVVAGGSYFLGGFGRLYAGSIEYAASGTPVYDSIIPTMLSTLPDLLIGLVIVLVLSASMSTLSSLVLTSSSVLTLDLVKDNLVKEMDEKRQLAWIRALLVVFVAISAMLALVQYTSSITFIAQLMSISWGALAGSFLGPFFWALYSKRISKAGVWASFILGVGITVSNMALGFTSPINAGALAMLVSLAVTPLVSLVTPAALPAGVAIAQPSGQGAIDRELAQAGDAAGDDRELAGFGSKMGVEVSRRRKRDRRQ